MDSKSDTYGGGGTGRGEAGLRPVAAEPEAAATDSGVVSGGWPWRRPSIHGVQATARCLRSELDTG